MVSILLIGLFMLKDDPYNNKLIDKRFFLINSNDSIDIDSLISYYYPKTKFGIENKNKTTFDDITIGTTILLRGKPNWRDDTSLETLYGQFFVSIPFGPTLKSFLSNRERQFNDAKVDQELLVSHSACMEEKNLKNIIEWGMYFQTSIYIKYSRDTKYSRFNVFWWTFSSRFNTKYCRQHLSI